ncbi:MAG: sterol desaturase family protein [Candidatus Rokubacteria bacterium]|nr:sterol desaturase family protein [Candidatus Rokubacteria bacterium]
MLGQYTGYLFLGFGLLFTVLELVRPARRIDYRTVVKKDIGALVVYQAVFGPAALYVSSFAQPDLSLFRWVTHVPWPIRIVLFVVLTDLASYWLHRAMHGRHLWRVHRWHHSPRYMYWLAGIRATLPQQVLFNLPGALCLPLLIGAPLWVFFLLLAQPFIVNDWMHANLTWRSDRLEWVLVTPRYHHVHHSADPRHHAMNLGAMFTAWDRLFGTYVNPDEVGELSFGIGTSVLPVRLALGL